jgi:hypothetical protein
MVLGDALLADESVSMIEALQEARAAFDAAEAAEEHRPDSAVFRQLVDMVLALFDLPASPAARASAIATAADAVRQRLGDLAQHDWHGYRSPRADVVATRVLATAVALERATSAAALADHWIRLDESLEELAALYLTVRGTGRRDAKYRLDAALGAIADVALIPALGAVVTRAIGHVRLHAVVQDRVAKHGPEDAIAGALTVLQRVVGETPPPILAAEDQRRLTSLAESAGVTPHALIDGLVTATERGEVGEWVREMGLPSPLLPIDFPHLFGADPAADEVIRALLRDLRSRLRGTYRRHTWEQMVEVLASIVHFARYVRDALPGYTRCAEDGGKGRDASERDLQDDLFRSLDMRFGLGATYERQKHGGGRPDTGVEIGGCRFPIEAKHEYNDVSAAHIRASYIVQSDLYAAAGDGVAFLVVLDLRTTNAAAHRKNLSRQIRTAQTRQPVSLYSLGEGFWIDSLPPDPQIRDAAEKPIIVGLFPGNRPLPSSTTTYSRRRDGSAAK